MLAGKLRALADQLGGHKGGGCKERRLAIERVVRGAAHFQLVRRLAIVAVLIGTDDVDHPRELHFSIGRIAITYLALNLLMPDRRNPRQHSPRQIRQISRSIEIFGFVVPILIDRNNYIVAGEGRYRASEYLGWL